VFVYSSDDDDDNDDDGDDWAGVFRVIRFEPLQDLHCKKNDQTSFPGDF